ncbi:hypothetical protein HY405_01740 [Candidatus Microgenomates bacterium]|nr:hypothetical protein [Candidatus Microgenomates bacterium]
MTIPTVNSKILLSGASLAAAAALIVGATFAFFSDTETSTGNTFVAGAIDLQIDNESYAIDHNIPGFQNPQGILVASGNTSWPLGDLLLEKFFDFVDLKPGDYGEDTISIHVGSNDAWLCAAAQITQDTDETCTEPEDADDPNCAEPGEDLGELDEQVNFAFWEDDGDNVLEDNETPFLAGPISDLNGAGQIALADSTVNAVFGQNNPVPGEEVVYIGKAWCFGTMVADGTDQDDLGKTDPNENGPLVRGTGFDCDGSAVDNAAQTDKVVGDLEFYAEQSRNNEAFDCDEGYTPSWEI